MNTRLPALLALAAALALPAVRAQAPAPGPQGASRGTIAVTFENPEKFTDLKMDRMPRERERQSLLAELRETLEREAPRRLPAGTRLEVTITDVDMAGEFEPQHGVNLANVRIVRDMYPARINLSFRLSDASGKTLKEGTRKLVSSFTTAEPMRTDHLKREKDLLEEWLSREFA